MKTTLQIIALRKTRYSDRYAVLSAFSRERGRVSLLVPDGNGKSTAAMRALLMPLSVVECEVDIRPGRDIFSAARVTPLAVMPTLRSHPLKQIVTMFLSELINGLLRDSSADERLFDFITASLNVFESMTNPIAIANFHLWMVYGLGCLAGVAPDMESWREGSWFDFNEGIFRMTRPLQGRCLDPDEAAGLGRLSRMTPENIGAFKFTREERNRVLDLMIEYLSVHYSPVGAGTLTTLDILREILADD